MRLVKTKSTIDPSYGQTGFKVDEFNREPFDKVVKDTAVEFSAAYDKLVDQFKKGEADPGGRDPYKKNGNFLFGRVSEDNNSHTLFITKQTYSIPLTILGGGTYQ